MILQTLCERSYRERSAVVSPCIPCCISVCLEEGGRAQLSELSAGGGAGRAGGGGAAGGGTRMRVGLDKREVESLAKTMEVKFTVAGPPIGGAKSGINFDPKDPRKEGVLRRWYAAV